MTPVLIGIHTSHTHGSRDKAKKGHKKVKMVNGGICNCRGYCVLFKSRCEHFRERTGTFTWL